MDTSHTSMDSFDSLSSSPVERRPLSDINLQEKFAQQLQNGSGECLLYLGGKDFTEVEYGQLVDHYRTLAKELDAVMLCQYEEMATTTAQGGSNQTAGNQATSKRGGWFLFRQNPANVESIPEVRIAVCGNVDAGKSTMLGVLTSGALDDGRGRARLGLFRHKHEMESGRTSSIGQEILAFDKEGSAIHPNAGRSVTHRSGWDEICPDAHKVITFMDLAGHERYLKTTMFGLTGGAPDYVTLIVGANAGLIGMAKEHLTLAFALAVPVLVVVTKIDMCPMNVLEGTLRQLQKILKSPSTRRTPVSIKNKEDVIVASQNFVTQRLCPIFQLSSVTGEGTDLLKCFLHLLPRGQKYGRIDDPAEFQITDTYTVAGVGTVVAGVMISGSAALGQTLYFGPDSLGAYVPSQIKGVQRKRVNVPRVYAGQCASFALKKVKRAAIRKGMMLLGKELVQQPPLDCRSCREFEAEVVILFHSTTIGPRYQAMLHCGVVRQTVSVVSLQSECMRTGDRAIVRFKFMRHPEYLKVGARLVFREGHTKGVGKITALFT